LRRRALSRNHKQALEKGALSAAPRTHGCGNLFGSEQRAMRDKLNAVGFTQRCDLEDLGHSAGLSNIRYQAHQPRIDDIGAVREGLTRTDCEPNQSTSGDELIEQKQLLCRCERAGKPLSRVKICGADALHRSQSASWPPNGVSGGC